MDQLIDDSKTVYSKYTGKEFKILYPTTRFVKLTSDWDKYNGCKFETGLNIKKYNSSYLINSGGIYGFTFIDIKNIDIWFEINNELCWYCDVTILDDSIIEMETYENKNFKCETNKFILSEKKYIFDDYELCLSIVKKYGYALQRVKNQTEELCKLAVQQNGYTLWCVKEQTEEICKLAVQQDGYMLLDVKEQTEEICKLAVQQNGLALQFVKEQTKEICKLAVQQNGLDLQFVKEQTKELCELAVYNNHLAYAYAETKHKRKKMSKHAIEKDAMLFKYLPKNYKTKDMCELAVRQNGESLKYIQYKYQTEDLCKLAVQQNYLALQYVDPKLLNNEFYKFAVQQNGVALKFIKPEFINIEICELAVRQNPNALKYVDPLFQTYDMCKNAVKTYGILLEFVNSHLKNYKLCELAVRQNGHAIKFVNSDLLNYHLYKIAVEQNINVFSYMDHKYQTTELCKYVIQNADPYNISTCIYNISRKLYTYDLYKSIIDKDANNIRYIREKLLSKSDYELLCEHAITLDPYTLIYINLKSQTYKMFKMAVDKNYNLINYGFPPNVLRYALTNIRKNKECRKIALDILLELFIVFLFLFGICVICNCFFQYIYNSFYSS